MRVGDKDHLGRTLKRIRGKLVLVRSRQAHCVAVCDGGVDGKACTWRLEGKTAMGVGSQHAATKRHKVVVTREVITEYDGVTPQEDVTGA